MMGSVAVHFPNHILGEQRCAQVTKLVEHDITLAIIEGLWLGPVHNTYEGNKKVTAR
jgi:hypothetical protein